MNAALMALVLAPGALQAPPPVFQAAVERVELEVWVSRHGRPVSGLTAANFEVRDNGVVQEVTLVGGREDPARPVLVLDVSGSVRGRRLEQLKSAAGTLLDGLVPGDQAALVTFSQRLNVLSNFAAPQRVRQRLNAASAGGATSFYDALYLGFALATSRKEPSTLVVFTDADDNLSWLGAQELLRVAEEATPAVHVVTVGTPTPFLERLAQRTGGSLFTADWKHLERSFRRVLENLRHRIRLQYEPRNVAPGGWHSLRVKLRNAKGDVRARPGYFRRPGR